MACPVNNTQCVLHIIVFQYKLHFDYFTVDFNEEFSAIHGGSLEDQTQFVAHCVERILQLYQSPSANQKFMPQSVVLIGHSIGGVIAKALFTNPEFDPFKVHTIITLATPHTPVVVVDKYTSDFYVK